MAGTTSSTPTDRLVCKEIGGLSIRQLAEQFGTPAYFYDIAPIYSRLAELASFDVVRYAQKANSNIAILDRLRRKGAYVDAVSAGEILRALAAGYLPSGDPPPIVFTADVFDRDALDLIEKHQIHCNLGSPDMIEQYAERVPGGEVTLRINPGFGHGHSQKTNTGGPQSKHGIWHEQLDEVIQRANQAGVTVVGLHMHIGSGTDLEHLAQVCGAMKDAALKVGSSLKSISAGGGLPIAYQANESMVSIEKYFSLWDEVRDQLSEQFGHRLSLEIEPGRYLAAESGYLLSEIRAIKSMGENTFYLLDAGFNTLARPILYGAYHPMSIATCDGREPGPARGVVVGGPLCESGDIFTQVDGGFVAQRDLPEAQVGDWVVIECAGAYGAVMASNYNSKPLPPEILLEDGKALEIRRRQSLEELFANEQIPPLAD